MRQAPPASAALDWGRPRPVEPPKAVAPALPQAYVLQRRRPAPPRSSNLADELGEPRRLQAAVAQPEPVSPMLTPLETPLQGERMERVLTTKARVGRPAPQSWARPTMKRRPARSTRGPAASQAGRWRGAIPSRSQRQPEPEPEVRHPTMTPRAHRIRLVAIPRPAQQATPERRAVVRPRRAQPAQAAPEGRPEQPVHPSWAPRPGVRPAEVVGPKGAAEEASPKTAPAVPIRAPGARRAGRPRLVRRRAQVAAAWRAPPGPMRAAERRMEVPAQLRAPKGIPTLAGRPLEATAPDPSWARRLPAERQRSRQPGLRHALRPEAPTWWRCLRDVMGSRATQETGTPGGPAGRPSCA